MIEYEEIGLATVGEIKSFLRFHKKDLILELKKEFDNQEEDYYCRIVGEVVLAGSLLIISLIGYVIADVNDSRMKDVILFFWKYGLSIMGVGAASAFVLFHLVNLIKAGLEYHEMINYLEQLSQDEELNKAIDEELFLEYSSGIKRVLERNGNDKI